MLWRVHPSISHPGTVARPVETVDGAWVLTNARSSTLFRLLVPASGRDGTSRPNSCPTSFQLLFLSVNECDDFEASIIPFRLRGNLPTSEFLFHLSSVGYRHTPASTLHLSTSGLNIPHFSLLPCPVAEAIYVSLLHGSWNSRQGSADGKLKR